MKEEEVEERVGDSRQIHGAKLALDVEFRSCWLKKKKKKKHRRSKKQQRLDSNHLELKKLVVDD